MRTRNVTISHVILSAVLIILISNSVFAQWGDFNVDQITDDGERKNSGPQALALDSNGNPHIAWIEADIDAGNTVLYNSMNSDGNWGYVKTLADTTLNPSIPAIAVSPFNDRAYAVYAANNDIYISYLNGMMWGREQVSLTYDENSSPTIAVDDSGYIHIAWIIKYSDQDEYHIAYAYGNIGNWVEMLLEDSELGRYGAGATPNIDVDSDRMPHIAYRGMVNGNYSIYHAWPGELGWQYEKVPSTNSNDLAGKVAIDSEDGLHFAMSGSVNVDEPTKCAYNYKFPDGTWGGPEAIGETLALVNPSLALDAYNRPHICIMGEDFDMITGIIYYAYKDNSGFWQCDSLFGDDFYYPCLKIDDYNTGKMFCRSGCNTGVRDLYYLTGDVTTSIDDDNNDQIIPRSFELGQNYPNPFNAQTIISFSLSSPGPVQLDVYDVLGKKVECLCNGHKSAGKHEIKWDSSDYSSGVYFYKLSYDGITVNKKAMLLK